MFILYVVLKLKIKEYLLAVLKGTFMQLTSSPLQSLTTLINIKWLDGSNITFLFTIIKITI